MNLDKANQTQTRNDIEKLQTLLGTLKTEFNVYRIDTNHKILNNKEDVQEQIYATDKYVGEVQSNLNREISEVRKSAFDSLKATEKELIDRFSD